MSDIEVASSKNSESVNNDPEQNSDFVDWINSFDQEENSNLNYPFDKWQIFCTVFWIFIFIICAILILLVLRK